jgi:prolipoprotein diacylglyceryltransferase
VAFPVYVDIGPLHVPAHVILEALAYAVGFQIYRRQRARRGDVIDDARRWTVIAAAAVGAAIGSKVLFCFEDPRLTLEWLRSDPAMLMTGKTIVGGLLGGTVGVEIAKAIVGERRSTGDLFVVPLTIGIAIGRIGCFLGGLEDRTFGVQTAMPWGVDFGDGVPRHPTQLYEAAFALGLGAVLHQVAKRRLANGDLYKLFLVSYLAFRLIVDGIKPAWSVGGLSVIQWTSAAALAYYLRFVPRMTAGAVAVQGQRP